MDSQRSTALWKSDGRDLDKARVESGRMGLGGWVCERDVPPGPDWKELTEKLPEEDCAQS